MYWSQRQGRGPRGSVGGRTVRFQVLLETVELGEVISREKGLGEWRWRPWSLPATGPVRGEAS